MNRQIEEFLVEVREISLYIAYFNRDKNCCKNKEMNDINSKQIMQEIQINIDKIVSTIIDARCNLEQNKSLFLQLVLLDENHQNNCDHKKMKAEYSKERLEQRSEAINKPTASKQSLDQWFKTNTEQKEENKEDIKKDIINKKTESEEPMNRRDQQIQDMREEISSLKLSFQEFTGKILNQVSEVISNRETKSIIENNSIFESVQKKEQPKIKLRERAPIFKTNIFEEIQLKHSLKKSVKESSSLDKELEEMREKLKFEESEGLKLEISLKKMMNKDKSSNKSEDNICNNGSGNSKCSSSCSSDHLRDRIRSQYRNNNFKGHGTNQCTYCLKKGHTISTCWYKNGYIQDSSSSEEIDLRRCFYCNIIGHKYRNCHKRKIGSRKELDGYYLKTNKSNQKRKSEEIIYVEDSQKYSE